MAAFSFVVCFLLLQLQGRSISISYKKSKSRFCHSVMIGVFGERYDVTVITDPPHGPFLIGNRINFTCHVYPMPPEPVTYSWHAISRYGPTTLRPRQKTTQYTPYYGDLHFSWFFCKVFSNETLIGVGRRLVEIHGKARKLIKH